ncbi:PKD domain-containing protein [Candidatus Bathyarchaeota archaeon]|nr:PKD domain-containing protein [Candidatus Bathyarchaeota archaeon]
MKFSGLRYVKRRVLTVLLLLLLCIPLLETFLPTFHPDVSASPGPTTVAVDPATCSANPEQYVTVNVTITGVTDLKSWGFRLGFVRGLLEAKAENITEGAFLKQGGTTAFSKKAYSNYIDVGCMLMVTPGVSGSGTLATATFKVLGTGNVTLDLYRVGLINSTNQVIEDWNNKDSPDDGYFYTTFPVARFAYTPHPMNYPGHPIVDETVTFNATESYDPDDPYDSTPGGIVSYRWDFDDGNITTVTNPIIIHKYTEPSEADEYKVNLTVTDDDGESYSVDHPIIGTTILVQLHDIAVINVTVTPAEVSLGEDFNVNVTVLNQGTVPETLNVTVYCNMQPVATKVFDYWTGTVFLKTLHPSENITTTVLWDTTGVPIGSYEISVKAFIVKLIEGKWQSLPELEGTEDMYDNGMFYGNITITGAVRHDLAITKLNVSPIQLKIDERSNIEVTIKNEGTMTEQFNATITIEHESGLTTPKPGKWQNQTIHAGTTVTLKYPWLEGTNTTKEGIYNITVSVVLVNKTTLDFLQPYNETIPDDDPTENTHKLPSQLIRLLPVAYFTYSPSKPLVDNVITFNASSSYAPGASPGTIVQYTWGFGDGTSVTETTPVTNHVFRLNRIYTVTLTVTDDENLVGNTSKNIKVYPFQNIAITNVTFSPYIAPSGDPVTINVTLNTRFYEENFNVTTYYNENIIDTQSNITQPVWSYTTLTFTWDTTGVPVGNYTIKAVATTVAENITYISGIVTIQGRSSTITLVASPASFTVGATTTLNGSISTAQSGFNVTIWYRLTSEETWNTLATVTTEANGAYSHPWVPETAGTYAVKSSWQGDDLTMSSESEVCLVTANVSALSIFLYTTVGLVIVLIATLLYFLKIKKP